MAKRETRRRADREQFWRDLIGRQQQSGQSIQVFCDSHGVSSPSYYSWRKRLKESNGGPTAQFVPVQIEREPAPVTPGQIEGNRSRPAHTKVLFRRFTPEKIGRRTFDAEIFALTEDPMHEESHAAAESQ